MQVLELVTFKAKAGINHEKIIELNEQIMEKVKEFQGFIYRSLCYQPTNQSWIDVVYWQDEASAMSGQEQFMQSDVCQQLMSVIDVESTHVQHADILLSSCTQESEQSG